MSKTPFDCTPTSRVNPETIDAKRIADVAAEQRYIKYADGIDQPTTGMDFIAFVKMLGLRKPYKAYLKNARHIFSDFASKAPAIIDGRFYATPKSKPQPLSEKQIVSWLNNVLELMVFRFGEPESPEHTRPDVDYVYADHQNKSVDCSSIKPDYVLYYPDRSTTTTTDIHLMFEAKRKSSPGENQVTDLGQMVEYALSIWEKQPTRLFVPVFFLNCTQMSLLIFARGQFYRIELGTLFRANIHIKAADTRSVGNTLCMLWFMIKQSPHRFGHVADVTRDSMY
ncbi:hypothetical protein LPJ73_000077 [Coemansia sp. RSA 2703]|nr:hypothetical protein LPJ73_000077 [Coemansia sp. RSA 2703]KAJ2379598.1 hypothetical protein IW150_000048 [Coemansia sp. RSA 2607]KAJ2398493.1 hypothetical protein GGI05_000049 [Coemansia sp. RSA 2603]